MICFISERFLGVDMEFDYHWCGKFEAQSADWMHMTRELTDFELILMTEGTLYLANETEEFAVRPGELLIMPPTSFQHGTRPGLCSFYWLHFSLSDSELLPASLHFRPIGFDRILVLMKQLMDSDRRYKNKFLNNALLQAILGEVSLQTAPLARDKEHKKQQLLEDVMRYVEWHIQENLKVSDLADYFGYNEKYLTTLFRSEYGQSLKQYILSVKMEHAKSALSESDEKIDTIAYRLGFADAHNFSNAFKKVTDFSPSAYRKAYNRHAVYKK